VNRHLAALAALLILLSAAGTAGALGGLHRPPGDGEGPQGPWAGAPGSQPGPGDDGPPGDAEPPPAAGRPDVLAFPHLPQPPAARVATDHVIVRFEAGVPGWMRRQIVTAAGADAYKAARHGAFVRAGVAPGDTVEGLLGRLGGMSGVVAAEADPLCWGLVREVAAKATYSDPFFADQWSYARIRLPEALDLNPTGGDGVIVAVIDSGVAAGSGDAFPARRGLDLGGTRFLPGLDLVGGGPPYDEGVGFGGGPGAPRFGHGTFVAAQIAATVNNGISGGSIAPRAVILPIRVLGADNSGTFADVAEGIDYAVAQGARVINMSLGGSQGAGFLEDSLRRAVAAGVVVVAAAGNEAEDLDFSGDVSFPARYPEVIAVGASTFADRRASYSDTGPNLEIMAPAGQSAANIVGNAFRDAALAPSFLYDPVSGETLYTTFWATGTSFASPQVAGAAALLIALGVDDPAAVRDLLDLTGRDLGAPGFDQDTGHGLVDLLEAHRGLGFTF
jgi:Subtilase family